MEILIALIMSTVYFSGIFIMIYNMQKDFCGTWAYQLKIWKNRKQIRHSKVLEALSRSK